MELVKASTGAALVVIATMAFVQTIHRLLTKMASRHSSSGYRRPDRADSPNFLFDASSASGPRAALSVSSVESMPASIAALKMLQVIPCRNPVRQSSASPVLAPASLASYLMSVLQHLRYYFRQQMRTLPGVSSSSAPRSRDR